MTTVRLGVAITVLLVSISAEAYSTRRVEPPPEDEITRLPTVSAEKRDALHEHLETLLLHYQFTHKQAVGEHYGVEIDHLGGQLFLYEYEGLIEVEPEVIQEIRVPLHSAHHPWIFDTATHLLAKDPPDWEALRFIMFILTQLVEEHPRTTGLAWDVLLQPLPRGEEFEGSFDECMDGEAFEEAFEKAFYKSMAIEDSYFYFGRHFPPGAPLILASIITLPHQPPDRDILPITAEHEDPETGERETQYASHAMELLDRHATPEQLAEVAEYIEADVEAGAFELDAETEEWLERIRQ